MGYYLGQNGQEQGWSKESLNGSVFMMPGDHDEMVRVNGLDR